MEFTCFPDNPVTGKFVKVQKNGPNSLSIGLPKIMATDLGIQKGTYVMVYQVRDRIIIEKAISRGE
jgi:antitoxin component of MazEF toxin-antitoxin module